MKKNSRLLTVVVAIAFFFCQLPSNVLATMPNNGYKIEANPQDTNELMLTISSTDGFVAYDATVTFNSSSAFQSTYSTGEYRNGLRLISREVKGGEANSHNLPTISSNMTNDTTLKVIVIKDDFTGEDLYTKLVIGIRVAAGSTATLTKIQAADEGTVAEDPTLLTFPAANESTGAIDQTAQYAIENAKVVTHTHSFTLTSVQDATTLKTAATCTTAAVYYKTCSCGAVSNDDNDTYTVGEPLGHSFTNYVSNNDATCTQDGTKTAKCDNCDETDTVADEGSALGHSYTNYSSDNNATCAQDGTKTAYCDHDCGNTDTITDEGSHTSVAHTWGEYVSNNDAKCLVDGTKTRTCSVCGTTETVEDTGSALGHNFETYTSNENGTHTAKCTRCEETDTQECNTNGNDGACSVCGYEAAPAEPVEIPLSEGNLAPKNMYFDSFVGQRIRVNYNANSRSVLQRGYADYKIEITYQNYNGSYMLEEKTLVFNSNDRDTTLSSAKVHYFTFSKPALYEMGLNYTTKVKLYDAEGNYIAYQSETTSVRAQALAELKSKLDAGNTKTVKALVDLVNFGAAAQTYFASMHKGSDIDGAELPTVGFEDYQTYASTDLEIPESFNLTRTKDPASANGVNATWPSVKIEAACSIAFNYRAGSYEAKDLTVEATYEGAYGSVTVETPFDEMNFTGTLYNYVFNGLTLYDMSSTINFTVKANGVTEYTSAYSTGYYLNETIASTNPLLSDFGVKLALFSNSVRIALVGA